MASSFWALTRTVLRHNLLADDGDRPAMLRLRLAYRIAVVWNVLCLLALQISIPLALLMWGLMFGVFAFPGEFSQLVHDLFSKGPGGSGRRV